MRLDSRIVLVRGGAMETDRRADLRFATEHR